MYKAVFCGDIELFNQVPLDVLNLINNDFLMISEEEGKEKFNKVIEEFDDNIEVMNVMCNFMNNEDDYYHDDNLLSSHILESIKTWDVSKFRTHSYINEK
jgi:hypothetical protein